MGSGVSRWRWAAPALVVALVLIGCSSEDPQSDGARRSGGDTTASTAAPVSFDGRAPSEISAPPAEGKGINQPQPAAPLPDGYVQEEYFLGGDATSFDAVDTPEDGSWTATPGEEAEYRTRVIVRRPQDPAAFSGTVLIEWFNVSALEAAPDWGYLHDAIGRDGHAYVGISAQAQGVEGGDTLLDVEVDEEDAARSGAPVDASGLKHIDPERYGTLVHPGDAYAYDIFSQAARAVAETPEQLLGELQPEQVIATGESQSAMFLSTYVNAVHPLDPVFDGFLIHSRGATTPALDGSYVRSSGGDDERSEQAVRIRTDLDVPVMMVEAETDLTMLGYVHARQPDTDSVRTWEIAGTAHADSETLRAVVSGPRDPLVGELVGCGSVNSGPHKEVLRAAVHHLVRWAAGGEPPPSGERLEVVTDGDEVSIARDEHGNALGGVRNPLVDVPVATLTGEPPSSDSPEGSHGGTGICRLFGQTIPFDQDTLIEVHGDAETYLERFRESAEAAVAAGFMLQADADALLVDIEPNLVLFP